MHKIRLPNVFHEFGFANAKYFQKPSYFAKHPLLSAKCICTSKTSNIYNNRTLWQDVFQTNPYIQHPSRMEFKTRNLSRGRETHTVRSSNIIASNQKPRKNQKKKKNWKYILQPCQSLSLSLVNGDVRGDSLGLYSCSSSLGNSTVDTWSKTWTLLVHSHASDPLIKPLQNHFLPPNQKPPTHSAQ